MRLHCIGLPHTQATSAFDWCAYTAKQRRLGSMLHAHGHELILYAGEENEAVCAEHVPVATAADREGWFGAPDWDIERVFDRWDEYDPCWVEMGVRAITEIEARIQPGDAVGIIAGRCQGSVAAHFHQRGYLVVEWGVGYEGVLDFTHRCFESEAWRHYVYGRTGVTDGRFFDTVIPNAYDPDELLFRADHDGYLLYLGRPTERKGLEVVRELARRHGVVTAGQGGPWCPDAEHVGIVLGDEKAKLLAGARAVLVPTFYFEPFGGVVVEAMLSGTPAITTDFGAFPETVNHGVSGFRCNTLREFLDAADHVAALERHTVRAWAEQFTLDAVAPRYDAWLRRLDLLHGKGWYG